MANYKLQPEAEKDLASIWLYTAKEWGVQQAMNYIDGLENAFQFVADNPQINRERIEFTPVVRIHRFKKHLVVYLAKQDTVLIVRVLHAQMDIETQLHDQ